MIQLRVCKRVANPGLKATPVSGAWYRSALRVFRPLFVPSTQAFT
jgi:hypothetical protein